MGVAAGLAATGGRRRAWTLTAAAMQATPITQKGALVSCAVASTSTLNFTCPSTATLASHAHRYAPQVACSPAPLGDQMAPVSSEEVEWPALAASPS